MWVAEVECAWQCAFHEHTHGKCEPRSYFCVWLLKASVRAAVPGCLCPVNLCDWDRRIISNMIPMKNKASPINLVCYNKSVNSPNLKPTKMAGRRLFENEKKIINKERDFI